MAATEVTYLRDNISLAGYEGVRIVESWEGMSFGLMIQLALILSLRHTKILRGIPYCSECHRKMFTAAV